MLVRFSLENWLSFRDLVTISMVGSRERQHGERVPRLGRYQTRILPIAAIYGGNASGKTNFFRALRFAKELVVVGTQPGGMIPVEPFRLGAGEKEKPSRFSFELLVDETIYEYSFAVTRSVVVEEKLVRITGTSEKVLFHRHEGKLHLHKSLEKDSFLSFAFQGTRDNQLFLTNSVSQNVLQFQPVYDWFRNTLALVAPDSRFGPFEQFFEEGHPLYATMNEILRQLDTGILKLGGEEVPLRHLSLPESLIAKLEEEVKEGRTVRVMANPLNDRFIVTRKEGELIAKKLVAFHAREDGSWAKFDIRQESDGSQRVIDLLPAFLDLVAQQSKKVFVIDEIGRSLHTLLLRKLLEAYLGSCSPESRSQLLFTTHDVLLMDQSLLRRDEMWVTERDPSGSSKLYSFSEFKDIRYDKDLRKSYLQGRLGGIPLILSGPFWEHSCVSEDGGKKAGGKKKT